MQMTSLILNDRYLGNFHLFWSKIQLSITETRKKVADLYCNESIKSLFQTILKVIGIPCISKVFLLVLGAGAAAAADEGHVPTEPGETWVQLPGTRILCTTCRSIDN